jgi:hypothetical protein
MMQATKETRVIRKQGRGVFLVESGVRQHRTGPVEMTYTVTAYWTPNRFYTGTDLYGAEKAFEEALARAPQRIR